MSGDTLITIVGSTTADSELRFTATGKAVANFVVASNARHYDKATDTWVDDPALFLRCSVWGQPAENVAESVFKGTRVVVTGRLKQRSYEKDGQNRTVIELEADEVAVSLRFASAKVNRADRQTAGGNGGGGGARRPSKVPDDPWGSAPAGHFTDDPPFFGPVDRYNGL